MGHTGEEGPQERPTRAERVPQSSFRAEGAPAGLARSQLKKEQRAMIKYKAKFHEVSPGLPV